MLAPLSVLPDRPREQLRVHLADLLEESTLPEVVGTVIALLRTHSSEERTARGARARAVRVLLSDEELAGLITTALQPYLPLDSGTQDPAPAPGDIVGDQDDDDDDYDLGDFCEEHIPGCDVGEDLGKALEPYSEEYWWGWNRDLDRWFFDHFRDDPWGDWYEDREPGEPSPPGDYPVPDGGTAIA